MNRLFGTLSYLKTMRFNFNQKGERNMDRCGRIRLFTLFAGIMAGTCMLAGCGGSSNGTYAGREHAEGRAELTGRDFVELGKLTTLKGILKSDRNEWLLVSGGSSYEIHLGDHSHRAETGIRLTEGYTAHVKGFLYEQEGKDIGDIAVCSIVIDNVEYRFRDDNGNPLWAGQHGGEGRGGGHGRGAGKGRQ